MAEFVQTMKDWRRMCKDRSCNRCILQGSCDIDPDSWTDSDIRMIETNVKIWAAEHQEPVYPTWGEWLESAHIVNTDPDAVCNQHLLKAWYYDSYIPADIAQKLGIEPKENL